MRQTRIVVRQAVALGGVLALAACSGGGGSSNSSQVSTASVADFETPEFESSPALGQINAAEGYASITGRQGGEGVRIAVLDDGVEADHLDLDDNIVADISFNDLVEVPFVDGLEDGVHGTAVAGVIAAEKNDSGMHGVAFEAGLVSIDISVADQDALDAGAEPNTEIFLSIAEGIRISAGLRDPANGEADIINMSLGLDVENITGNDALSDAVVDTGVAMGEAADQGKIIVVAAGNGSAGQVSFPGGFVDVADIQGLGIVVSSVDADDNLSAFSNQCGSDAAFCLVAPGEQIRTTLGDNTFGNLSGTSFSTPFVSGSAAVVKAAFPGISNRDVVARLLSTAEDLGAPGTDAVFGRGRLDLDAALAPVGSLGLSLDGAVDGDRAIATESRLDLGAGVTLDGEGSALLAKAVAFDEQGFPFGVDLSRQADDRSRSTGLAAFVGTGRQDTAVQNSAFGSLSLALAEEQPEDLDAETAAFAPSDVSLRAQQASPKLRFTSNAAPDLDMFMSLNGGSGTDLALGRALAAADGRFFQPGIFLAPYDDIAGQQSGAGALYRLNEDTELAVSAFAAAEDSTAPTQASVQKIELARRLPGEVELRLGYGLMQEAGGFLGSATSGAFGEQTRSDTQFLNLSLKAPLDERFSLFAAYNRGRSTTEAASGSLLGAFSAIETEAFGAGLLATDLLAEGDGFSLMVGQPLRAAAGSAEVTVPIGRTPAGEVLSESVRAELRPEAREIATEAVYRFALDRPGQDLAGGAFLRLNPDHDPDAAPDVGLGVRYRLQF